mgnify:CR=1 FL=1
MKYIEYLKPNKNKIFLSFFLSIILFYFLTIENYRTINDYSCQIEGKCGFYFQGNYLEYIFSGLFLKSSIGEHIVLFSGILLISYLIEYLIISLIEYTLKNKSK